MRISTRTTLAPTVLALGVAGAVLAGGSTGAFAATRHAPHAVSGAVVTANAKTHELVVKVGKADDHFKDSATTKVVVAGKRAALESLKAGEKVTVTYTVQGKTWTATAVSAKKA